MKNNTTEKSKKVLASLVMGINAVNIFAPMAQGIDTLSKFEGNVEIKKEQEIALDKTEADITAGYETLSTVVEYVDDLVFNKAHAWTSNVNGSSVNIDSMVTNDWLKVTNGVGTVTSIDGGRFDLSGGGTGIVETMNNGMQMMHSLGTGNIFVVNNGIQDIQVGGIGSIGTMSGGNQIVSGLYGRINVMNGGTQILTGGENCWIGVQYSGEQKLVSGISATISHMFGGTQVVGSNVLIGRVYTNFGGVQEIDTGARGAISIMQGGTQNIAIGGTGNITAQKGGTQNVSSDGVGYIVTQSGAAQNIYSGGYGSINKMYGGTQVVDSAAIGSIGTMVSVGKQVINGGTGSVDFMNSLGAQIVTNGGIGTVGSIYWGGQDIYSGATGIISKIILQMASQNVYFGGTGIIHANSSGYQYIRSGGVGTVGTVTGARQYVYSGGTGFIGTMQKSSWQQMSANGVGYIEVMSGGSQSAYVGGTGYISVLMDGWQGAAGTAFADTVNGGGQTVWENGQGYIGTMNNGFQDALLGTGVVYTMNGGSQRVANAYHYSGVGTVVNMNTGAQIISSGGTGTVSVMNSGSQIVYKAGVGMIDTLVNGIQSISSGGTGTVSAMINGSQYIASSGAGRIVNLNGGSVMLNGGTSFETVMNDGTFVFENDSGEVRDFTMNSGMMFLNADQGIYKFTGFFELNGGIVDMTEDYLGNAPRSYETINIETLRGSGGKFKINTDLASETNSDMILIAASDPGTVQYVQVVDESLYNGQHVTGMKSLMFAADSSDNVTFQGLTLDNGGLWETTPRIAKLEDGNWYLTTLEIVPNPSTETLIGNIESSYGLWRNIMTDDTITNRLGDLRLDKEANGVWARVKASSIQGQGYDSKRQMFQVGIDKTIGNRTYGFAVDHSNTKGTYAEGNGKGSMTGISLYMTNYQDDGMYGDLVLRAGRLRSDMDSYGDFPDSFDFDTNGYSISYELGKTFEQVNGWFVEPQVQLAYGRLSGGDYTTERGVKVDRSAINSLLGRLGFTLGRRLNDTNDYYLKANFYREFAGKDTMDLVAANGEVMNYVRENKGNWFELGIGGNVKLAEKTYLYGDVAKTFGGDIKKKWQVNAGMRFTW